MRILYDSQKAEHKTPFGCVRTDEKCTVTIYIPESVNALLAQIVLKRDDGFTVSFPMCKTAHVNGYDYFSADFSLECSGLYFYFFEISKPDSSFRLYKLNEHDTNMEAGEMWQLTCFDKNYDTPHEFKGAVMYQIFPDRFFRFNMPSDLSEKLTPFRIHKNTDDVPDFLPDNSGDILNCDFFGGTLSGIAKKLPYIAELSVSVIYLNPIFHAYSNHRYDTADYKKIDPLLGDEKDFAALCSKAHSLGIKIILDGVFSHTGDNSVYFDRFGKFGNGAVSNPNSPYREWYTFSHYPDKYESWWGISSLPAVKETTPSYMDFIINNSDSVCAHWLNLGADGFRLDVADELPDEFIAALHKRVKEIKPSAILLGEVWEDASNKVAYNVRRTYFTNNELDSVMNYPYKNAVISYALGNMSVQRFCDEIMTIAENYPKPILDCVMNSLSTHDTARILTVLSGADFSMSKTEKANYKIPEGLLASALETERFCAFLQFMLPGSACIYYGDEIGMQGFEDPLNRGYFKWNEINKTLHDFYVKLCKIKASHAALKYGSFEIIESGNALFAAKRACESDTIIVYANASDENIKINIGESKILFAQNADILGDVAIIKSRGFILLST